MSKQVLIVGAGIGGLATAVRLLSRGYKVEIYEKEETIGGKINFIEKDSFKFDLTASILIVPEVHQELFTYAGKNYKDYLDFMRIEPAYRVHYSDGSSFDFSSDMVKLSKVLESISKADAQGYMNLLADVYNKYLLANKYFLTKSFTNPIDFFNPVTLSVALRLKTLSTSYKFISKYVKSQKLRDYLAFQALYVGISPYEGSNIYTLVPVISEIYGLWYLKGGMYSYIRALERLIIELGGTIYTNSSVEEILISQGKAVGIRTNQGTRQGDIIVCNADFPYAMEALIEDNKAKGKYTDTKISKLKHSCSTFIIHLGLKKKYPKLMVHNIYIGQNFKDNIQAAFMGKIPKELSLYMYCPSRMDETMAAEGTECLNIVVRVPNLLFDEIVWDEKTIQALRQGVFDSLHKIDGLQDIEKNIAYESYITPKDLSDRFNAYGGAAFGLSHTLTQTNYFRPQVKSPTVSKLYFVGSSVHPGTGGAIVLLGSSLVAEEILKESK